MARIVIIGNGISGVTAARHIRKRSDDEILIISLLGGYLVVELKVSGSLGTSRLDI